MQLTIFNVQQWVMFKYISLQNKNKYILIKLRYKKCHLLDQYQLSYETDRDGRTLYPRRLKISGIVERYMFGNP